MAGLQDMAVIERKSMEDLVACVSREGDRAKVSAWPADGMGLSGNGSDVLAHALSLFTNELGEIHFRVQEAMVRWGDDPPIDRDREPEPDQI